MSSPSKPRSHYARGHQRRADVIAATIEVIADRGIEGVTHRSVAAAAGVSLSTTSYFFASLDELIGAAVTTVAEEVVAGASEVLAQVEAAVQGSSAEERIERIVALATAPRPRRVVAQFEAYLATTRRPELVEPVRRIVQVYNETAVAVLRALGAADPVLAARQLVAMLDGLALQEIASPRADDAAVRADALKRLAAAHLDPARPAP